MTLEKLREVLDNSEHPVPQAPVDDRMLQRRGSRDGEEVGVKEEG